MAAVVKNPMNLDLVNHFTKVASLYYSKKDTRKGGVFSRVATIISELDEVCNEEFDLTVYPRVGSSSQTEKNQFLQTGTSERLVELMGDAQPETFVEKLARLLTLKYGNQHSGRIKSSLLLTFAMNRIQNVDDALEKVDKFEKVLEEHIKDVLLQIKGES